MTENHQLENQQPGKVIHSGLIHFGFLGISRPKRYDFM